MTADYSASSWKCWSIVFALNALAGAALFGAVGPSAGAAEALPGEISQVAQTAYMAPGRTIEVQSSATPFVPTQAQLLARAQAMAGMATHRPPPLGPHTSLSDVRGNGGAQTSASLAPAANSFVVFKNSIINSACSGCGQSTVNEPAAANSGRVVVETSNWNIAYTVTGGAATPTWLNQNPYTLSPGFCCDQEVVYDPGRDIFILLQLDYAGEGASTNGLQISVAHGNTPTSWCTYKFAGAIGGGATDTPDFPKIAVSNNNIFITWNDYPPNSNFTRSGLARMPIDPLAACAGFNYSFLTRTTEFTFALAQAPSALDQFYWVSNWMLDGTVNGQHLRIFYWPDNSGSYSWVTPAVNAYTFGTVSCGSPNWCSRLDPRYESVVISDAEYRAQANAAFAGDALLEVATTAGPSGFSNGKNYVVYNYFKLHSLAYIGNDQTYNTTFSFAYPGCTVNAKGYVGCSEAYGLNAPGGIIILQDNVSPTQPWGYNFVVGALNGAAAWGDYIVTEAWRPTTGPFQTVLWRVNGSNAVEPHYIVFGRGSDTLGYNRWKTR